MRQKKEASFNFLKEDSTETTIRRIWSNPKKAKKEPKAKKGIVDLKVLPVLQPQEDYIFTKVEINAEYVGGRKKLMEYFEKNIIYPNADTLRNVNGTVVVGFTIGKDGKAVNFKLIKGVNKFTNEAVFSALEKMRKWTPAIQNGYTVEQYFEFAFQFKIKNTVNIINDGKPSK